MALDRVTSMGHSDAYNIRTCRRTNSLAEKKINFIFLPPKDRCSDKNHHNIDPSVMNVTSFLVLMLIVLK